MVGSEENPADPDELEAFANMLANSWLDPNLSIVWHHAVKFQPISGSEKLMPLRNEFDSLTRELMAGLMLNESFLYGTGPTYANASVALDMLIARYQTFRQRLERWIRDHFCAPICRIHKIYKPTEAELRHRIRVKGSPKKEWVPNVAWSKYELRDNYQKVNLYERLHAGGLLPAEYLYRSLNLNPAQVRKKLEIEMKERAAQPLPAGPGIGMPPGPRAPMMPMAPGAPGAPLRTRPGEELAPGEGVSPGTRPIRIPEAPPNIRVPGPGKPGGPGGPPRQRPPESERPVGL